MTKYFFVIALCGKSSIFLLLRFCVKLILANSEVRKLHFVLPYLEDLNCYFYEFLHFLNPEISQIDKINSPEITKTAILELLDSPKLISRKSECQKTRSQKLDLQVSFLNLKVGFRNLKVLFLILYLWTWIEISQVRKLVLEIAFSEVRKWEVWKVDLHE